MNKFMFAWCLFFFGGDLFFFRDNLIHAHFDVAILMVMYAAVMASFTSYWYNRVLNESN